MPSCCHWILQRWHGEATKLERGEITAGEYNDYRYTYPAVEAERTRAALDELREKGKAEAAADTGTTGETVSETDTKPKPKASTPTD